MGRSVFKVSKRRQNLLRENCPDHLHYIPNAHPAVSSHLDVGRQQEKITQTRRKRSQTEKWRDHQFYTTGKIDSTRGILIH